MVILQVFGSGNCVVGVENGLDAIWCLRKIKSCIKLEEDAMHWLKVSMPKIHMLLSNRSKRTRNVEILEFLELAMPKVEKFWMKHGKLGVKKMKEANG